MKQNSSLIAKRHLKTIWMPRFHACGAVVFSILYLLFRRDFLNAPDEVRSFLHRPKIDMILFAIAFFSATTGVLIGRYVNWMCGERTLWGMFFSILDADNYRLEYYRPYLYFIFFVIFFEGTILFLRLQ